MEIKELLLGENLTLKKEEKIQLVLSKNRVLTGVKLANNNQLKETLLYLKTPRSQHDFNELTHWYNKQFNQKQTHTKFNSWHFNSKEYLLYLQADSSIFVSIYLKK